MRNVVEHPLQPQEVIEALDWALDAYAKTGNVGGIHGYALFYVKDLLLSRPFVAEDVCARAHAQLKDPDNGS